MHSTQSFSLFWGPISMLKEVTQELGLLRKDGALGKAHETVRKRQIIL